MPTLTKENAKFHCRACLKKLCIENKVTRHSDNVLELENVEEERENQEIKDNIYININANKELHEVFIKIVEEKEYKGIQEFPQNLCLNCYNKIQTFEKFRRKAQESAEKLYTVLSNSGVAKIEIEYDDAQEESSVINNDEDIYKLLLKDTLMETESVLLDSSTVATLASVKMDDPDPFSTETPSKVSIENAKSSDEDENDEDEDDESESTESSSDTDENEEEKNIGNNANFDKKKLDENNEKQSRRMRVRHKRHAIHAPEKKKRRTKKEMEEWRQKMQTENLENKMKRRNKGTKNSFKCSQCNHCFAHKITLDAHIRKVHEGSKRPFQCDKCEKSYTFIGGLYTHIKEIHETEIRSYTCDHPGCERIYTSYIAMQKHKRLKHSEITYQKKYVCEQCGATFNQSGNLKYHRRTKHPTDAEQAEKEKSKEKYECDICKKLFHSRYTLKYHTLQLHSDDMKYECNVCGRRMAKKFMLVQHMLVHSTDKIPCEHCGKQFIRKFELEAHIRAVHMKLKPFECQYCSECFASRKTMRHHEYIHTGEKPYVCDICGQAYRQQTCLKNHRKSHEKLSAEANLNRILMNTFLGPSQSSTTLPSNSLN